MVTVPANAMVRTAFETITQQKKERKKEEALAEAQRAMDRKMKRESTGWTWREEESDMVN